MNHTALRIGGQCRRNAMLFSSQLEAPRHKAIPLAALPHIDTPTPAADNEARSRAGAAEGRRR